LSQDTIKEILSTCKTVAVVGLSREPEKESYTVAAYLKEHGFRIVPINPFAAEILGEKSYKSLLDLPAELRSQIDLVNVFRRPDDVKPIVEQVVKLKKENGKPCAIWMQLGIVNEKAADAAWKEGLAVVMDKCIMVEHRNLSQSRYSNSV